MIKSIVTEYGMPWAFNRTLYSTKLKMMKVIPATEGFFEKEVNIQRIDIFDLNTQEIDSFINKLSEGDKDEIINIADRAIDGKITGFSSIKLDYGSPINWHYSPLTKKEVDSSLKWYEIPDFDPERGDIKAIWEISRFTHLFYFVRAYMLTKDQKYFEAFSEQIASWLEANKYSYGSNYKCGQEATLRMINVLIAYTAFKSYGIVSEQDERNVQSIVEGSYKKVLANFFYAHKCIKNNHTLSEITGLIIGAWSSKNEKGLDKAYHLLDDEIKKQFHIDGGYRQYSFNYQRFALQIIECVLKLSEVTKRSISDESKELIKRSAYLMYQMQDETGELPNYGSNDGALIFPVTSCGFRDFTAVINTIYSLIDGKRVYTPGNYDEEILWFGNQKLKDISFKSIKKKSSFFQDSGYASLRFQDGFLMTVLQGFNSRPAQMDQNHIDVWHKGVNIFSDSGTYSYANEIGKAMSLTAAHNTVKIDDKEQMKKRGPFLVYDWTKRLEIKGTKNSLLGTMKSENGYTHKRVIERKRSGFLVQDTILADGKYCEVYLHTPCDVEVTDSGFELYSDGKKLCSVTTSAEIVIKEKYRSLFYLQKEKINCVVINKKFINDECKVKFEVELL